MIIKLEALDTSHRQTVTDKNVLGGTGVTCPFLGATTFHCHMFNVLENLKPSHTKYFPTSRFHLSKLLDLLYLKIENATSFCQERSFASSFVFFSSVLNIPSSFRISMLSLFISHGIVLSFSSVSQTRSFQIHPLYNTVPLNSQFKD